LSSTVTNLLTACLLQGASVLGFHGSNQATASPEPSPLHQPSSLPSPAPRTNLAQEGTSPDELWRQGQRLAAVDELSRTLDPASEADVRRLAGWQLTIRHYEGALATLDRLSAPPHSARPLDRLRGEALYALTRYEEALAFLDPSDERHVLLIVDANEALGRIEAAASALVMARTVLGTGDPRLAVFEGRALARSGEHRAAVERFRVAIDTNPIDQAARFGLGRSLLALGEREAGLAELEEHRRRVPLIDALDFARQSLDLAPTHAPNVAAVGDAERALGLAQSAYEHYTDALELADRDQWTAIALRAARVLEEDLARAEAAWTLLAEGFDSIPDVRLAVRAGDIALRAGRPDIARGQYTRALALRPDDAAIQRRLEVLEESNER
jgi:tetratricopeptide (TPR) repeat protein